MRLRSLRVFKIQKEQVAVLKGQALEGFLKQAVLHLRRDLTDLTATYSDNELRQRIKTRMERARAYGLSNKREIMCFVDVSFLLGERFDSDPAHAWVPLLLHSPKLSSGDRANLLLATACSVYRDSIKSGSA